MGMYDSFYDEDSECPKCHTKINGDWQTKDLYSLMEYWRKGDWVQYRKLKAIPENERKRKYGDLKFAPLLQTSKEYLSDAPLLFNGKVPVHTYCRNCNAWLEAYARVLDGRFVGIVEVEADGKPKEFVLDKTKATAETLRQEFQRKLAQLQESCSHKKTQWMDFEWAPAHFAGQVRVCFRCEKIMARRNGRAAVQSLSKPKKPPSDATSSKKSVKATRNMVLFRQACSPTGIVSKELSQELKKGRSEDKSRGRTLSRDALSGMSSLDHRTPFFELSPPSHKQAGGHHSSNNPQPNSHQMNRWNTSYSHQTS